VFASNSIKKKKKITKTPNNTPKPVTTKKSSHRFLQEL